MPEKSDDQMPRANLVRPPGPIPTMAEVVVAYSGLCHALSIGGSLREKAGDLCDLIRRAPLYVGDEKAATVLEVEQRLGRARAPLWVTASGLELWPPAPNRWRYEIQETPYGQPDPAAQPRRRPRR